MYNISDYAEMLGGESCRVEPTVKGVEEKTNVIIQDITDLRQIKNTLPLKSVGHTLL